MAELAVHDLNIFLKKRGTPLVKDMSFSLRTGGSLILLGQSGCGKTMTCRALTGLLDKKVFRAEGSVTFDGAELLSLPERRRRDLYGKRIAFVPQNPMTALDPSVTVGRQMTETLRLHTDLGPAQRRQQALESLEQAGLKEAERVFGSRPYMLSGGMLQRALIAMALSTGAQLVIADEPTTALDVVHRNEIVDAFAALRENGAAVLLVTHDFAAALRMGGDLLVMKDGSVIERGETAAVFACPREEHTRALVRASLLSKREDTDHADC
ncbi:MAG: ABC transporter ATP-binding protein [Clostridia bacterium]|nr:ABC transporter ATP-binding protein [Clostridia bacterium]